MVCIGILLLFKPIKNRHNTSILSKWSILYDGFCTYSLKFSNEFQQIECWFGLIMIKITIYIFFVEKESIYRQK